MTQGIYINGRRPASKKEIKEYVEGMYRPGSSNIGSDEDPPLNDPYGLVIEATSVFGNEFDGSLAKAYRSIITAPFSYGGDMTYNPDDEGPRFPQATGITFVGPDPRTSRKFDGQIKWNAQKERFVVS